MDNPYHISRDMALRAFAGDDAAISDITGQVILLADWVARRLARKNRIFDEHIAEDLVRDTMSDVVLEMRFTLVPTVQRTSQDKSYAKEGEGGRRKEPFEPHAIENWDAFVYTVVSRRFSDRFEEFNRRRRREMPLERHNEEGQAFSVLDWTPCPDTGADDAEEQDRRARREEQRRVLEPLIEQLPERRKEAVRLRMQGYAYEAIAEHMKCALKTAYVHLHRAKNDLMEALARKQALENAATATRREAE